MEVTLTSIIRTMGIIHLSAMMESPEYLIKFYCKRGLMENFIKESLSGFDFTSVSSNSMIVNANRLQIHALAYKIFNCFRRLALSASMRKTTYRYRPFKTVEDCCKSNTFSKVYNIQAMQQLSL